MKTSPKIELALNIIGINKCTQDLIDIIKNNNKKYSIDCIVEFLNDYDHNRDLGENLFWVAGKVYTYLKNL